MAEIDLWRLRAFVTVAEELHFGRAAKRLNLAQPTLTRQIQALETQIGVRLLTRGPRGVSLTDAGRELYEEGDRLLDQSMRTVDRARRAGQGELGHVSVGFVGSAVDLVVETVGRMRSKHPEVSFSLAERPFRDPLAGLTAGEDDLALVRDMTANHAFELIDLAKDESCLVVSAGHRLSAQARVKRAELEELGDEAFLSTRRWMGLWGFQPRRLDEVASTQATLRLIASGVGISLMPSGYQSQAGPSVRFIPVEGLTSTLQLALPRTQLSPAPGAFAAMLTNRGCETEGNQ